jgi:hypothetical protein
MNMHASLHSICKLVGSIAYSTIIQCNKKLGIAQSMCATGSRTLQQEAARCSAASPVLYFFTEQAPRQALALKTCAKQTLRRIAHCTSWWCTVCDN